MMMNWMKTLRFGVLAGAVFAVTYLPSAAWAQCAADPTGETPIGVVSRPDARGPGLEGVGVIEFLNATVTTEGSYARGARITVRLRRSNTMLAFFALIPEYGCSDDHSLACNPDAIPDQCTGWGLGVCQENLFDSSETQATQEEIIAALREDVLAEFYTDECGPQGDQCPEAELVFKKIENFAVFDDFPFGGSSQFVISDIVVATTEPL